MFYAIVTYCHSMCIYICIHIDLSLIPILVVQSVDTTGPKTSEQYLSTSKDHRLIVSFPYHLMASLWFEFTFKTGHPIKWLSNRNRNLTGSHVYLYGQNGYGQ